MSLWLVLAVLAASMTAMLLVPLFGRARAPRARREHDIAVHRRQLAELEEDLVRGLIGAGEAATARLEIERRLLRLVDLAEDGGEAGDRSRLPAIVVVLALPAIALGLYALLGSPGLEGAVPAPRPEAEARAPLSKEVRQLRARLAEAPGDVEGWRVLGHALLAHGRATAAAEAFYEAVARAPGEARSEADLGEALTLAAEGTVRPAARAAFEAARARDPALPRPHYYLALAEWQAGRPQAAFDGWLALAKTASVDAPWLDRVLLRLARAGEKLAIPLEDELPPAFLARLRSHEARARTAAPGAPDPSLVEGMDEGERAAFIGAMVARLAARLEQTPEDFDGWMRLGRAYGVLQRGAEAVAAYGRASALRPEHPAPLVARARASIAAAADEAALPAAALDDFRRVLELDPEHGEALWFVGLSESRSGRLARAVELWERLLAKIEPGLPQADLLAGEIARARAALEK